MTDPDVRIFDLFLAAGYSAGTCAAYTRALRWARAGLAELGATLDDVSAPVLGGYAESLPATSTSRSGLRSALSGIWRLTGHIGPIDVIRVPRRPQMRSRTLEECPAGRLCAAGATRGDRKGLAVAVGLYTGMRPAEIASLRWSEVHCGWISFIRKGNVEREVPIHPNLDAILDAARTAGEFVFLSPSGGPISRPTLARWVREVACDAGIGDVTAHILRHTSLTAALEATHDLRAVQGLAGHVFPQSTAGYARVSRVRTAEAVGSLDYQGSVIA